MNREESLKLWLNGCVPLLLHSAKKKKKQQQKKNSKANFCKALFVYPRSMTAYINSFTISMTNSNEGKRKCFLFWLFYKRNGKSCSCATIELWIHLGGLLSTQEARVALGNSYAFFVLSNLPRASMIRWLHAARLALTFTSCVPDTGKLIISVIALSISSQLHSFFKVTGRRETLGRRLLSLQFLNVYTGKWCLGMKYKWK